AASASHQPLSWSATARSRATRRGCSTRPGSLIRASRSAARRAWSDWVTRATCPPVRRTITARQDSRRLQCGELHSRDMRKVTRDEALEYHRRQPRGKVEVVPTKPTATQFDLSLAYTPGVAEPCLEIAADPMK